MVKPPKRMEPESVELSKAGRSTSKAFQENSFANYMARKIEGQRQTKGCVLPPDPREHENHAGGKTTMAKVKEVRFAPDVVIKERTTSSSMMKRQRPKNAIEMMDVVKRLKMHHGHGYSERQRDGSQDRIAAIASVTAKSFEPELANAASEESINNFHPTAAGITAIHRPDLFFLGVVVLVNGYTNPDTETIHRLLHKHGGDLEKYETSRVTHIIAENLSFAKANVYKKNRKPRPVCKPAWIVDSVVAQRLLPFRNYLLDDVRKEETTVRPLTTYFSKQPVVFEASTVQGNASAVQLDCDGANTDSASTATGDDCGETIKAQPLLLLDDHANVSSPRAENLEMKDGKDCAVGEILLAEGNSPSGQNTSLNSGRTDDKYINGRIRTIGTDPKFLESFFSSSRLSFIGSYKQRMKNTGGSPTKKNGSAAKHKQRYVMHVDMDSFFCSVVLRSFPQYRDKPVVISHHGMRKTETAANVRDLTISNDSTSECATCNYEARRYGIKKGMYLGQAKQLCKDLVVLHYDFEGFEEVSEQVAEILFRNAAKYDGTVEQVSCDEAFLELFLGIDAQQLVEDVGRNIRREIYDETQCTATVGISSNKLLAKLATDKVKPNGLLYASDYRELLQNLRLRDLHGIGYRLEQKLAAEGLEFVQDVWAQNNKDDLVQILGKATGSRLHDLCFGKDDRPVEPAERKSIGAECNYGIRFNGPYGPDYAIDCLAQEVEKRMFLVCVKGTKITLKLKQRKEGAPPPPKFLGHGSCHNLSRSRDAPGGFSTREHSVIRDVCRDLYSEMAVKGDDVRGLGIVITKLVKDRERYTGNARDSGFGIQKFFADASANLGSCTTQAYDAVVMMDDQTSGMIPESSNLERPSPFVIRNALRRRDHDWDFELPSMSQIHMSQIDQLPSPMRRQATRRIKDENAAMTKKKLAKMSTSYGDVSRWKQTNVKRLFQLAAVKTGEAPLHSVEGAEVSLRDFESLPLEMQLQLANNDVCSIGVASNARKRLKFAATGLLNTRRGTPSPRSPCDNDAIDEVNYCAKPLFENVDQELFFREDLLPLNEFLDEHSPDVDSIQSVRDFFGKIISEGRLRDASVLLRSVHNRGDDWSSSSTFDDIFGEADGQIFVEFRKRLDKAWLCAAYR
ncbi:hypothetical protein MPSEU_000208800 [Mayamaea pseudoterrestris]|nr:hypothetical protein MPSEU_000208800 [Mayamaea pseudoterrestris]